jgi:hypothetical protein
MREWEAPDRGVIPEAAACFALIIQGSTPWTGVVEGIESVKETLLRILWRDPEGAVLGNVASTLGSLDEPAAWAVHGAGDGRPYWHWWVGYEGGSVTVQRLTEPLPSDIAVDRLRSTLDELIGVLVDHAEDLRKLSGAGNSAYVFARRPSGGAWD